MRLRLGQPSTLFLDIIFALMAVWFVLLSVIFFINQPITLLAFIPDIALTFAVVLAAYALGSAILELARIDEILPTEDFVFSTAIGLGGISFLTVVVSLLGFLTWWTISIGMVVAFIAGSQRILGLLTPPTYLFGPEDVGEEAPSPISWAQFIIGAIWIIALFHFCLLPPVAEQSLAFSLGLPSQWVLTGGLSPATGAPPEAVNLTSGLYAFALALRGPHLAMMISALVGGLTLAALYACGKRYCGPEASRSTFLVAASLPIFSYALMSPGDSMLMALYQFCSFFLMMRWFDEKRRRWALLSGIMLGLSVCVSTLALFFVAPLLVAAFSWAATRRNALKFITHLAIGTGAAGLWFIPWMGVHAYLFENPFTPFSAIGALNPPPLRESIPDLLTMPLRLSLPGQGDAIWQVLGPIFLIFVPFYFLTQRKNPMTGLATSIGLAALVFGRPFGVPLEMRLGALLMLSIPAAMAAHRIAEAGWKRNVAIGMLYLLILWHIFHSTAVVESIFNSPHRFLLGLETEQQYLERSVDYYPAAQVINQELPADAMLLGFGQQGRVYIDRHMVLEDTEIGRYAAAWLSDPAEYERGIERLRRRGFTHVLINLGPARREAELERVQSPEVERLERISDLLDARRIMQWGDLSIYRLSAGEESP